MIQTSDSVLGAGSPFADETAEQFGVSGRRDTATAALLRRVFKRGLTGGVLVTV